MKTQISLLGKSFILHSDQEEEYVQYLVDIIDSKIRLVKEDLENEDPHKLLVLAALLLAHDLEKATDMYSSRHSHTKNSVIKLIDILDKEIKDEHSESSL